MIGAHTIRRGLAHIDHRLASQRLDLVTHRPRPLRHRRRRFARGSSATSGPAGAAPALSPPPARSATPAPGRQVGTGRVERRDEAGSGVASPFELEEPCRASISSADAADSSASSRSKAAQSTLGLSARRKPQHTARPNIHWGTSKLPAANLKAAAVDRQAVLDQRLADRRRSIVPGMPSISDRADFGLLGVGPLTCNAVLVRTSPLTRDAPFGRAAQGAGRISIVPHLGGLHDSFVRI